MANNTRYYYSLPTEAPARSRSASRRPPLTPSTVSSPCLTTHAPIASRRDSGSSGSPTKASALLAKVVSSPTTPRGETPAESPTSSPEARMHLTPTYSSDRPKIWRTESDRYVRQYRQQGMHHRHQPEQHDANMDSDGYISFPDFERFRESQNSYDQHRDHTAVKT